MDTDLELFVTYLSKTIKATSIKVYLGGIRSLHIENSFANPLSNCLRLERMLRGIKRSQGIPKRERLPITLTILSCIRAVLDLDSYYDTLFWVACCTGFAFDSRVRLAVEDVRIDQRTNPRVVFLRIKCSKTRFVKAPPSLGTTAVSSSAGRGRLTAVSPHNGTATDSGYPGSNQQYPERA